MIGIGLPPSEVDRLTVDQFYIAIQHIDQRVAEQQRLDLKVQQMEGVTRP